MSEAVVDWNDENLAKLESGLKAGKSASQIAREIPGATRCAVIGKTRRLYWETLRPEKLPPSDAQLARKRELSKERNFRWRLRREIRQHGLLKEAMSAFTEKPESFLNIPLIDLANHLCHWPGDKRRDDGSHGFCGQPTVLGSPYCAHHLAVGTVNITRKSSDIVKILQKQGVPV